ncbi:M20/M25/M40 family metallo-hydrolase [Aquimarina hainanensis]|uniref:M20/M25/M40 family metallo-hydrolase n=1 Tax=Aquimarina hainanensis TaxID=1578017 RepID=A0ABW5N9G5_9FLAO
MKKINLFISVLLVCLYVSNGYAQQEKKEMFYATMETKDAIALKKGHPEDVKVIASKNGFSAVMLSHNAAEELHHKVLVHGPGFVYEHSEKDALRTIENEQNRKSTQRRVSYTITQDRLVKESLDLVNNVNIANQIKELERYGTRYHTTSKAKQSVTDLKRKWEQLAGNRSDVSVRLVNHNSTSMPSLVMTIRGTEKPDDYVIIGGHIDSVSPERTTNAPGADDNASGIATITEAARVLFQMNFKPKRTIEFMAYAAEEVGLRGSKEIAEDYKRRNVNVVGYVQFDMTNYKGSSRDIYITDDSYNSQTLNSFLRQLMDHYNVSGTHKFTYGTSRCNYGCSDHYSWAQQGYQVSFPIEATFRESNPNIHTTRDTFDRSPTPNATHAAKFTKLALEFLIEVGNGVSGGGDPVYCASKGKKVTDEYIGNVKLGSIDNTTDGSNGYGDHTGISTNLSKGNSHTITITPKWSGTAYDEGYAVWIDYNQDKDFKDAGELVWSKAASKTSPVNGSFTVPSSAKNGRTRMRVSMKYNGIPTACETFDYGEVEDYTVVIGGTTGGDTQAPSVPGGLTSSNVTQNSCTLSWNASTDNVGVTGYILYRGSTNLGTVSGISKNVSGLAASTTYEFKIKAKDAAGNESAFSDAIRVTTTGNSGDICDGVPAYDSSQNYQVGDKVTYFGRLYEKTSSSWRFLGNCGTSGKSTLKKGEMLVEDAAVIQFSPNPVKEEYLTISIGNELWKVKKLLISDMNGKIIRKIALTDKITKLLISDLASGTYFISLEGSAKKYTQQLLRE